MRTLPNDNFTSIEPEREFVAIEVWKQLGATLKWRVEKPGRVAVMDGQSTSLFIRPDSAQRFPHPAKSAFDTEMLLNLTNVHEMFDAELHAALAHGSELKINRQPATGGQSKLLVTVETQAGLPPLDYVRDKFFFTADLRRVYRFDAAGSRLEGFDAYVHRPGGDVLVLSVERIEYIEHVDPAIFTLKLPEGVQWSKEPEPLTDNRKYEQMTPKQAAQAFFEACAQRDWSEAEKFWYQRPMSARVKSHLGGLKIVHLGEPFQSAISLVTGDWFVPYEIKFPGGRVNSWNLALRKNPSVKRYIVDGGI
jgi:hypothetical protein